MGEDQEDSKVNAYQLCYDFDMRMVHAMFLRIYHVVSQWSVSQLDKKEGKKEKKKKRENGENVTSIVVYVKYNIEQVMIFKHFK